MFCLLILIIDLLFAFLYFFIKKLTLIVPKKLRFLCFLFASYIPFKSVEFNFPLSGILPVIILKNESFLKELF